VSCVVVWASNTLASKSPAQQGIAMTERRYKIVVAMEKFVETFKVICAVTGETISIHESRMEAQDAVRRYQAADVRRRIGFYSGDMS
jgi:hypothetical protein